MQLSFQALLELDVRAPIQPLHRPADVGQRRCGIIDYRRVRSTSPAPPGTTARSIPCHPAHVSTAPSAERCGECLPCASATVAGTAAVSARHGPRSSGFARSRPALASSARRSGDSSSGPITSARDTGSRAGTNAPVTESTTVSDMPPTALATTGTPQAMASSGTMPNGSCTASRQPDPQIAAGWACPCARPDRSVVPDQPPPAVRRRRPAGHAPAGAPPLPAPPAIIRSPAAR